MLDPKEEARFDELKAKCRELKVPAPPEIMIGLKVHDKNGILTFDDVQRGHSWTRNYWNMICGMGLWTIMNSSAVYGAGYLSMKRITGAMANVGSGYFTGWGGNNQTYQAGYGLSGALGVTNKGIVVGTDDTAASLLDYHLVVQNTAMVHNAMPSWASVSYNAGTKTWTSTFSRLFNNNSGSSITIKEVGLYGAISPDSNSDIMNERSVLSPTVAVANGAQLTVTYEISMDFSAID
jgi:hypothetical protein